MLIRLRKEHIIMVGKTHIAGGVALASITSLIAVRTGYIDQNHILLQQATILTASGLGSLLPDIDMKGSTISNSNKLVSFFTSLIFTHRGFTHSPLALFIVATISFIVSKIIGAGNGTWIAAGFSLGYASHILLDSFNPKGVPLLYPLKRKFSFGKIVTGTWAESLVFFVSIGAAVVCEGTLIGILSIF